MRHDQRTTDGLVDRSRLFISVTGTVQGVGFRPFVFRLANALHLSGYVLNDGSGVRIEIEGEPGEIEEFRRRLNSDLPPRATIYSLEATYLDPTGTDAFTILPSVVHAFPSGVVLPDIALCDNCRSEIFDPLNRRYLYPFTNCTNCGPRYSIITGQPYDRSRTTMRSFQMCPECQREYDDPQNRRFHAQPNACPLCGPAVALWNTKGEVIAGRHDALLQTAEALNKGNIVAVKGIGGFQLLVDATNDSAVQRLRNKKHREEKPMAVMMPDLMTVRTFCHVRVEEERILLSPESPILLLERREDPGIASSVAPGNPFLGVVLPYSPLHAVLLDLIHRPVVATSGNRTDEPMCIDEIEALERLSGIADLFLVHDRPIVRYVDDSVVRIMAGREQVIRRARGFAPLPVVLPSRTSTPLLCMGAHQKNAVVIARGDQAVISQHIGDLDTFEAREGLQKVADDMVNLYPTDIQPSIVCDLHPEYASTMEAHKRSADPILVQHHLAHAAACRAENRVEGEVLAVTWDGTGLGTDGSIWGGEFFVENGAVGRRCATLRSFPLLGGDRVAREPRRSALGMLSECYGVSAFDREDFIPVRTLNERDRKILRTAFRTHLKVIRTTSMGRLFDGVASLLGVRQTTTFEGQAAMELEYLATGIPLTRTYAYSIDSGADGEPDQIDWRHMIREIAQEVSTGHDVREVSAAFHATVTEMIVDVAHRSGQSKITLSGGCFQNKILLEAAVRRLEEEGFVVYWHQRIPTNDGGIAFGQAVLASRAVMEKDLQDSNGASFHNHAKKEETTCA